MMLIRFSHGSLLVVAMLTLASCVNTNDRYAVAAAGQGVVVLRKEPGPPPAPPKPSQPAGPTTREIELQRRINELEAQSTSLQTELDRLRREKASESGK
jgi:hypothetical protein